MQVLLREQRVFYPLSVAPRTCLMPQIMKLTESGGGSLGETSFTGPDVWS